MFVWKIWAFHIDEIVYSFFPSKIPKAQINKTDNLTVVFALSGSARTKAGRIQKVDEIDPECRWDIPHKNVLNVLFESARLVWHNGYSGKKEKIPVSMAQSPRV